jgi:hypothetical protein
LSKNEKKIENEMILEILNRSNQKNKMEVANFLDLVFNV